MSERRGKVTKVAKRWQGKSKERQIKSPFKGETDKVTRQVIWMEIPGNNATGEAGEFREKRVQNRGVWGHEFILLLRGLTALRSTTIPKHTQSGRKR